MSVLEAKEVSKIYCKGKENEVTALNQVSLAVESGEFISIMGPSGSGKSTLLHVLSGLDTISLGTVEINDTDISKMGEAEMSQFRRGHIGYVFQNFNLIDSLSVHDNIALPLALQKGDKQAIESKIQEYLTSLNIASVKDKLPNDCSGVQCQRTAIARALVHGPSILFADEPTGNLDSANAHDVLEILQKLNSEKNVTIMMVTHDSMVASYSQKVLFLRDGVIEHVIEKKDKPQTNYYEEIASFNLKDRIHMIK